jgi:serine/threonine-protein kinase
MAITLTVLSGPHAGQRFTFAGHETFLVGRSAEAHLSLPNDPYFSRAHFLIELNPPLARLLDLQSHNGTQVNGQPVQNIDLRDGDRIQAGQTTLHVCIASSSPADVGATQSLPPRSARENPAQQRMMQTASSVVSFPGDTLPTIPVQEGRIPSLPGYVVEEELGRGGMGVVYRAVRQSDGARVAIKMVCPARSPTSVELGRFLREIDILRQLRHAYIVGLQDSGEAEGVLYFVMDLVEGIDAGQLVKQTGPLSVGRAVRLACQLLEALAFAHQQGFVHRDVKPANLLVTGSGAAEMVRLADFGLGRAYQSSQLSGLTMTGAAGGTPAFMAPEQVLDFRTVKPTGDQYAAAATLYTLLTSKVIFDTVGNIQELFKRILTSEPAPLRTHRPDLPEGLAATVHRALARQPDRRFPDVLALRQALLPFAAL